MSATMPPELVREEALLEFVPARRWFGAKASEVTGIQIADAAVLREEAPRLLLALAHVRYGSGMRDVYQLVIGITEGSAPGETIDSSDGETVYEALTDPLFVRELFDLMRNDSTLASPEGAIEFSSLSALGAAGAVVESVSAVELEQSNSSVIVDDELIVKAYRRLEAGINPELELLGFFAEHGFENVPRLAGSWSYSGAPLSASLGIVQQYVPAAVDGWSLAVEELPGRPEEFVARLDRLGTVVGEMHAVLASDSSDPVFSPEEASQESLALLTATVDEQINAVFAGLPELDALTPIAGHGDAVRDLLHDLSTVGSVGKRIRHHGDLHLGQTLWANGDWLIIDFEGEPARPLSERRLKASPLRDVAGMLRSFTYVTRVAGIQDPSVEEEARERFLDAYFEAMRSTGVLPPRETAARLLRIFELEKAVYELGYEIAHRPDWVDIPVAGIVELLEGPDA
jgi:maltokinase